MILQDNVKKKDYMIAIRDPHAGQPFQYSQKDGAFFFSSGTFPFERAGIKIKDIKEVPRGSMTIISENGEETITYKQDKIMACVFERIYFGCPDDRVLTPLGPKFYELFEKYQKAINCNPEYKDMPSNYLIRNFLGACLIYRHPELKDQIDLLTPIVDTGKGVTYGMSMASGIPFAEALIKKLPTRSFQISDEEFRKFVVDLKTSGLAEFIERKRIGAGDDSVVRGGVGGVYSKKRGVLGLLELLGAESIHMLISYSPMPFPSLRGFTPYHRREKMAAEGLYGLPLVEQEKTIGSKMGSGISIPVKLYYQRNEDTHNIFGPNNCFACMDGIYPVDDKYIPDWVKAQRDMSYAIANKK
jgi:amidophosphoribosyltransferase